METSLSCLDESSAKDIAASLTQIRDIFKVDIASIEEGISELRNLESTLAQEETKILSGAELASELRIDCSEGELISWSKIPWRMNRLGDIRKLKAELALALTRLEAHLERNQKALSLITAKVSFIAQVRERALAQALEQEKLSLIDLALIANQSELKFSKSYN